MFYPLQQSSLFIIHPQPIFVEGTQMYYIIVGQNDQIIF